MGMNHEVFAAFVASEEEAEPHHKGWTLAGLNLEAEAHGRSTGKVSNADHHLASTRRRRHAHHHQTLLPSLLKGEAGRNGQMCQYLASDIMASTVPSLMLATKVRLQTPPGGVMYVTHHTPFFRFQERICRSSSVAAAATSFGGVGDRRGYSQATHSQLRVSSCVGYQACWLSY